MFVLFCTIDLDMNPLENVRAALAAELEKRAESDKRIEALRQSIKLLEPIYDAEEADPRLPLLSEAIKDLGLTRAIEQILRNCAGKPLPPTSVRNGLREAGFELTGDNPLASIHQVLKRLVARENSPFEAVEFQGQTMYKYVPQGLAEQLIAQFTNEPDSASTRTADAVKKRLKDGPSGPSRKN
jgi:hypothetical protein